MCKSLGSLLICFTWKKQQTFARVNMFANDSKRQVYFIFHINLISGSHCIYNIWPSRRWPSSKKDTGWWCYHHSAPACSWALPTTLLWRRQDTAIQIQVSSWPSIQKVLEVSGQLYFWNFSDQHIPSLVWNPRNKETNKTFLYGWLQLVYRGETYWWFL